MLTIVIIVGDVVKKSIAMKRKKKPKERLDLCQISREFIIANFVRRIILLEDFCQQILRYFVMASITRSCWTIVIQGYFYKPKNKSLWDFFGKTIFIGASLQSRFCFFSFRGSRYCFDYFFKSRSSFNAVNPMVTAY